MKWKYYIPHTWDPPSGIMLCADVWLLPDDPEYRGKSVWLTIEALGTPTGPPRWADMSEEEAYQQALKKLGDKDMRVEDGYMLVRVEEFNRKEFLEWVEVWMNEQGIDCTGLIEGSLEEFRETNEMAKTVGELTDRFPAEENPDTL